MSRIFTSPRIRLALILAMTMILTVSVFIPVQAAEFDHDGTIGPDEIINDDVFISGNNVTIAGTVNGVLFASGENVTISGTINGDAVVFAAVIKITPDAVIDGNLFAAGSSINVSGEVTGSIASGSSSIQLSNVTVGRNVYYGGYSLETTSDASIAKDLYMGGYQAVLNGEIERDANISSGALEINGTIGRNANLDVASSTQDTPGFSPSMFMPSQYQANMPPMINPGLRVGQNAEIGGKLVYTSPEEQGQSIQSSPQGGIIYQTPVPTETELEKQNKPTDHSSRFFLNTTWMWMKRVLQNLISLFLLGLLAIWLIPTALKQTSKKAEKEPLPAAGYGFLSILMGYAGAFIAFFLLIGVGVLVSLITLGGLGASFFGISLTSLGLITAVFQLMVSYGSKVIAAYMVGDLLLQKLSKTPIESKIGALAVGVVLYVLVRSIPFIGWIFGLAATVIGLGAVWLAYREWRQNKNTISGDASSEPTIMPELPEA